MSILYRVEQWEKFAMEVAVHIRDYTCRQYGDYPNDKLTDYNVRDCLKQLEKYVDRNMNENARGQLEMERDMLKVAHYACVALAKLRGEEEK